MKITPVEIRNQEFKRSMRGYDTIEVDTFLELIANDYTTVIQQNEELKSQLTKLELELKNFKEVEKTLKQTLYNVQETSQLSKENSQKAAVLMKREAELAASQMIERARAEVNRMREEMTTLRTQKHSFISRLRHLLNSQIELIDILQMDDRDVVKIKDKTKPKVSTDVIPKPKPRPVEPMVKMSAPQQIKKPEPTPKMRIEETKKPEPTRTLRMGETKKPESTRTIRMGETKKPEPNPPLRMKETNKPTMDDFFQDIFGEDDEK